MIDIATLRAAGLTDQQIVRIIEIDQASDLEKRALIREQTRIRVRNHRERNAMKRVTPVTSVTPPPQVSPPSSFSPTPPHITTSPSFPSPCSLRSHSGGPPSATRPSTSRFPEFWAAYPRRDGSNPRAPAEKKFAAFVKSGTDPAEIIAAAGRYAAEMRAKGQERTPFVAQAMTWLSQQRWGDYSELSLDSTFAARRGMVRVMPDTAQWEAWRKSRGKPLPVDRDGGWWCPSEWPVNGQGSESHA